MLCSVANLTPIILTGLCAMPELDDCRNVFSPVADMYALIFCVFLGSISGRKSFRELINVRHPDDSAQPYPMRYLNKLLTSAVTLHFLLPFFLRFLTNLLILWFFRV